MLTWQRQKTKILNGRIKIFEEQYVNFEIVQMKLKKMSYF